MRKISILTILSLLVFSCNSNDNSKTDENIEVDLTPSNAIAVYNQAYQENFEADIIEDIITDASNAYVLIDPFLDNAALSISDIKANGNEIGAYISIGTGEDWREDFDELQPFLINQEWEEWPGEYFVDNVNTGIVDVMKARIDKIADWGCDWVEFDNMDWATDDEMRETFGFNVSQAESVAYYQELCDYVHLKGMKCMAKNTVENASNFDGVLYESYKDEKNWWDVSGAQSFLDEGKIVIINHYNETACAQVYSDYKNIYNNDLSFICEDVNLKKYVHFNE